VLPDLLDGQKKKYQEDFAAIPLVPKLSDHLDKSALQPIEPLPKVAKQPLDQPQNSPTTTTQLPPVMQQDNAAALPSAADVQQAQVQQQQEAIQQQQEQQRRQKVAKQQKDARKKALQKQQQAAAQQLEQQRALAILNGATPAISNETKPKQVAKSSGHYVLQLGAFNNASTVSEKIALLRSKGFNAYSLPAKPVNNQLNRILLGPSDSKQELERLQAKIETTLKLKGMIISNPANN
jgi:DedD protein